MTGLFSLRISKSTWLSTCTWTDSENTVSIQISSYCYSCLHRTVLRDTLLAESERLPIQGQSSVLPLCQLKTSLLRSSSGRDHTYCLITRRWGNEARLDSALVDKKKTALHKPKNKNRPPSLPPSLHSFPCCSWSPLPISLLSPNNVPQLYHREKRCVRKRLRSQSSEPFQRC